MNVKELLSPEARDFLNQLHFQFESARLKILSDREERAKSGRTPDSWDANKNSNVRKSDWVVASIPEALKNRTVEITGPADAKMIINALNSDADVFMVDFEDSLSPTWKNVVEGHIAVQEALRRTLEFKNENGKVYKITSPRLESSHGHQREIPTLIVRPRGWHLLESDFLVDGEPISASLFDFGLYLFHGAQFGIATGRGPFFYLPKLESAAEARLWAQVFSWSELNLDLTPKSIRSTVLIETLPAAFSMEEILFELRDSVIGLNAGRWDYLFSVIKTLAGTSSELIFPDRSRLTMDVPFLKRYCEKIVSVCQRRGAAPMGGMSALIPSRKDVEQNDRALKMVRLDKEREVQMGFVGTWVAHPDLIPIAREAFESYRKSEASPKAVTEDVDLELLPRANDEPFLSHRPTSVGVQVNIDVALRYLANWLSGLGAVAIHGLMEDAATAEISRAQLWQWRKENVRLETGDVVTSTWLAQQIRDLAATLKTTNKIENSLSIAESRWEEAEELLISLVMDESKTFSPFLTLSAMDRLKHNMPGAHHDRTFDREI